MSHHAAGSALALYRVFVAPMLLQRPVLRIAKKSQHSYGNTLRYKSTSRQAAQPVREVRAQRWNEEIQSEMISLIDSSTNRVSGGPVRLSDVLASLDLATHRLVEVQANPRLPICRIVNKKEDIDQFRRRKEANRERKKQRAAQISVKTLEINWAIDVNDLSHRLDKFKEFLEEGRKVEIVLAAKKRGRRAEPAECQAVLKQIRAVMSNVQGAKESKAMEGVIGGVALLSFTGRNFAQPAAEGQADG